MGKIMIPGSGAGGIDEDELTASAAQVLEGYKAGVKDHDEPVDGTMANKGAVTGNISCGNSYTIPAGYHNGTGKITANTLADQTAATATSGQILNGRTAWVGGNHVTGSMPDRGAVASSLNCSGSYTIPDGYHNGAGKITANNLASQTSATVAATEILSGKTAWVNGAKITGTIPSQGGSVITPGTGNKTIVSANRYVTGDVVVVGNANLRPEYIKKGVNIFGVTGTWSGYVPTATDLYLRGANIAGWMSKLSNVKALIFDSGQITIANDEGRDKIYMSASNVQLKGFNFLNIEFNNREMFWSNQEVDITFKMGSWKDKKLTKSFGMTTFSYSLSAAQMLGTLEMWSEDLYRASIYRIWLS